MTNSATVTILITSAGSGAALNCINALQSQIELPVRLVAADANPLAAGLYLADKGYVVPVILSPNYIETILKICQLEGVDVILPCFSTEIRVFAASTAILARHAIRCLVPPADVVRIFEDKWLSYQFLRQHNILTPPTWLACEVPMSPDYPLYLKPRLGSGSRLSYRIDTPSDLDFYRARSPEPSIVQKFVDGPELTIDALADNRSQLVAAIPRERLRVRHGVSVTARTITNEFLVDEVQRIVSLAGIVGPVNLQGILNGQDFFFTDINTRFAAGGLPLTDRSRCEHSPFDRETCSGITHRIRASLPQRLSDD